MGLFAESIKIIVLLSFAAAILWALYRLGLETGLLSRRTTDADAVSVDGEIRKKLRATSWDRFMIWWKSRLPENVRLFLSITLVVLFTRLFLYLVGYLGVMLFEGRSEGFFQSLPGLWNRWDAPHYLSITEYGYQNTGDERFFIVFFPFYPLLVRGVNLILGNVFASAIVVSNLGLVIGSFYLYKLARLDYPQKTASLAVKFLLVFPASFFLGAPFSDSTFLALTILCLYYARKGQWHLCGFFGLLATLTRLFGILLLVPLLIELLLGLRVVERVREKKLREAAVQVLKNSIWLFLIPIGVLVYLYINHQVTGSWFTFLQYQREHWHQSFGFFAENVKNFALYAASWKPEDSASLWIPQLVLSLAAIPLIFHMSKKLRISYVFYSILYMFVCLSPTWLLSVPRYMTGVFPLYLSLALASRGRSVDTVLTTGSLLFLGYCTLAFVTGHLIM